MIIKSCIYDTYRLDLTSNPTQWPNYQYFSLKKTWIHFFYESGTLLFFFNISFLNKIYHIMLVFVKNCTHQFRSIAMDLSLIQGMWAFRVSQVNDGISRLTSSKHVASFGTKYLLRKLSLKQCYSNFFGPRHTFFIEKISRHTTSRKC